MSVHPLTAGLLASIAMRSNHAMFLPAGLEEGMMGIAPWRVRIPDGLRHAREAYSAAVAGRLTDVQLLEEIVGLGFYSPEREDHYLATLDAFPGMREIAESLAGSWKP